MRSCRVHAVSLVLAAIGWLFPLRAGAVEALDGRLQIHGFGEAVVRVVSNDFSDDYDVWQWQYILNIETEFDIAPDGWGPFSAISAYARVEARYDCIWSRGCSMFPSMDAFGDRVHKLPKYKTNGQESKFTATTFGDPRRPTSTPAGGRRGVRGRAVRVLLREQGLTAPLHRRPGAADLQNSAIGDVRATARDPRDRGGLDGRGTDPRPAAPQDDLPTRPGMFRFIPNATARWEAFLRREPRPRRRLRFGLKQC
jgi:hypothetical protein